LFAKHQQLDHIQFISGASDAALIKILTIKIIQSLKIFND